MKEHAINKSNNFICGWYSDKHNLCDDLLDYFNRSPKSDGSVFGGLDKKVKDSLECSLSGDMYEEYALKILNPCIDLYIEKFPMCNHYAPWGIIDDVNIQYYKPGAGFHAWHTERCQAHYPSVSRHLVFMTYLNDVTDGGETEWYHQKIKVRPQKGLTIVWNSDWTFTHRGLVSSEDKYIVTGWFNFLKES